MGRFAAEFKDLAEPLRDSIKRKGGIKNTRRGLLIALGEVGKVALRAAARCHSGSL